MPDLVSPALRKHYKQLNDRTTSKHSARNDNRLRKQQLKSGQQQQQLKEEINCCITMEAETTSGSSSKCAKWWLQLATQEQVSTLDSSSSSEVDARSFKEQQHQCRSMELAAAASAFAIVDTSETRDVNQANLMHTTCIASNCKIQQTTAPTLTSSPMTTSRKQHNNHNHHLLMSCLVSLILVSCAISILDQGILQQLKFVECSPSSQQQPISVVEKLKERGKQLTELGVKTGAAGQISDWFVHQVAPMVATKIIDNVLSTPSGGAGGGGANKKSKSLKQSESQSSSSSSSGSSLIDTHALADKIVDHLADSIKKRKSADTKLSSSSSSSGGANQVANDDLDSAQSISAGSSATSGAINDHQSGKERAKQSGKSRSTAAAGASRRGKSLVSDSVQQVMQNLFSKDAQRTFFGRAMEKHSTRHQTNNPLRHTSSSSSSSVGSGDRANSGSGGGGGGSSWMIAKEPVYEPHLFVNTDSSQLDENPVVLRAEHGHNSTTIPPPTIHYQSQQQHQHQQQQLLRQQQQQQYNNKLKLQQQQQNKYNSVHTNRHNQLQHLAPKPWQSNGAAANNRRQQQQQSPYSLSVTSDINIVQAPSSPAPPPITSTSTQPTTTTTSTTSTTTTALPQPPALQANNNYGAATGQQAHHNHNHNHHQITHIGTNKFKINNRHQYPSSTVAISPNSWSSSNHNSRHGINYQQHNQNHQNRYPLPSPSSTSTSTTTTTTTTSTTTTTTTTPEPVTPQTEPMMAENELMDSESEQPTQSSPLSSSLSSVALLALDALGSSSSSSSHHSSNQIDDNPYSPSSSSSSSASNGNYDHQHSASSNSNSSSSSGYYKSPSSSSSGNSSGGGGGGGTKSSSSALPSTTSARHSILSSEAIPTALGAPLYHLMQANYTTHSFIGSPLPTPSRRGSVASPVAKALGKYIQKGMNNLSSNIFSRQSKGWARRLGISSVLLSVLYGAAVLSNPGAPLPANGLDVIRALTKGLAKKRRGGTWSSSASSSSLTGLGPLDGPGADNLLLSDSQVAPQIATTGDIDRATNNAAAILDNNVFLLYQQQPHLMSIIEHLIQQEQLQHQQQQHQQQHQQQQQLLQQRNSLFTVSRTK